MQWLRSFLFTIFFFVTSLFFGLVIALSIVFPFRVRFGIVRGWARTNLTAVRLFCGLDYVVEGLENIPTSGAHISYWKHSSAWETMAQSLLFPPQSWVLKREILWIPLVGWGTLALKPIAIDRSAKAASANQVVTQGLQRLKEGLWVLVFPEGTRVQVGKRHRYGLSGAMLASQAGVMIVPVAHNAGRYWGRRGLLKQAGTIRVVIGPPISAAGRDARAVTEEARSWIDEKVTELGG